MNTKVKSNINCDFFVGSVLNGVRQPLLFRYVLDKLPGSKVFCQPETLDFENINKSVSNIITFVLETAITKKLILMKKRCHLLYNSLKYRSKSCFTTLFRVSTWVLNEFPKN